MTPSQVILFGVVPLTVGFLLLQGYVTYTLAGAITALEQRNPFGLNSAMASRSLLPRDQVGYLELTIPDNVVKLLNEVEKDENSVTSAMNEISDDRHIPERQSPNPFIPGPVVSGPLPAADSRKFSAKESFEMTWTYDQEEKLVPYLGNNEWMRKFPLDSRAYYNSLATFPWSASSGDKLMYHGLIGVYPNGTQLWNPITPVPEPISKMSKADRKAAMKRGGFYLDLSNALPLSRPTIDYRDEKCKSVTYDYTNMTDASVVITFYNEPISTLLRTVHSVLNQTPPSLLREIILVDDHSRLPENLPGSELYEHIKLLPKTKLMRLPERRGLVWARLAGAQVAKAPILVVLDSHVEVNINWLEPQLLRLQESPKSIVFPQILSINPEDFSQLQHSGIGCWISWKWSMIERSTLNNQFKDPKDALPSPSMAGGLFATTTDWFWEIGGYDEEFAMWGSENVEMGFRTWMCGGRLECTPCSLTYHIYRMDGVGYSSPSNAVIKNKIRTARLWLDEWYPIAKRFIGHSDESIGNIDKVLELKDRLKCKSFEWFLENVDPKHEARVLDEIAIFGEIRSVAQPSRCVDTLNHLYDDEDDETEGAGAYGTFSCHGKGGTQGWFGVQTSGEIRNFLDESTCLGFVDGKPKFVKCWDKAKSDVWSYDEQTQLLKFKKTNCLTLVDNALALFPCDLTIPTQKWKVHKFEMDSNFALPDYSLEYKRIHGMI